MPVHLHIQQHSASRVGWAAKWRTLSIPEFALLRVVVNEETIPPHPYSC